MRYLALATDYDGTLAHDGRVRESTLAALERLRGTGRRLILVTGRVLPELLAIFSELDLFEWVVAENGAVLYKPSDKTQITLAEPPPARFVELLKKRGVRPLGVGAVIVATWRPHEAAVLDAIRELGLELQVIFNKDAVMVLPGGVNKASGLAAALKEMALSPHEVVGVGDAENDHAFLSLCECAVAVANALPALKERADLVTRGDHGAGVAQVIDKLIADDLKEAEGRLTRHHLLLGTDAEGAEVSLPPHGLNVLIAGPSGSGESTTATGLLERLEEHRYQFCLFDPEGDYETFEGAVAVGDPQRGPSADEVLRLVEKGENNVVVNLTGMTLADRPPFFAVLLPRLLELRGRTGRPHFLVVDEAHHLLPASWEPGMLVLPATLERIVFITVEPNQVAPTVLAAVDTVLAVGRGPDETVVKFCEAISDTPPAELPQELETGEVLLWRRASGRPPFRVKSATNRTVRRRHTRKYAEGEMGLDKSFYFRGPENKLNLRAQNLMLFLQLGDGVDDETWLHHLHRHDYSGWFREFVKDEALATEAAGVEERAGVSAEESRRLIRAAVERRYTLPAAAPLPMPGTKAAPKRN